MWLLPTEIIIPDVNDTGHSICHQSTLVLVCFHICIECVHAIIGPDRQFLQQQWNNRRWSRSGTEGSQNTVRHKLLLMLRTHLTLLTSSQKWWCWKQLVFRILITVAWFTKPQLLGHEQLCLLRTFYTSAIFYRNGWHFLCTGNRSTRRPDCRRDIYDLWALFSQFNYTCACENPYADSNVHGFRGWKFWQSYYEGANFKGKTRPKGQSCGSASNLVNAPEKLKF